jgi:hypothetical protein
LVFLAVSFPLASPPITYTRSSSPPFVLHVPPISLGGPMSLQHDASSGCGWRNGLQLWRLATNILNKQNPTNDKEWTSSLGAGRGANNHSL